MAEIHGPAVEHLSPLAMEIVTWYARGNELFRKPASWQYWHAGVLSQCITRPPECFKARTLWSWLSIDDITSLFNCGKPDQGIKIHPDLVQSCRSIGSVMIRSGIGIKSEGHSSLASDCLLEVTLSGLVITWTMSCLRCGNVTPKMGY